MHPLPQVSLAGGKSMIITVQIEIEFDGREPSINKNDKNEIAELKEKP